MDFYQRVEEACLKIPYGKVASYGQIALLCQRPNHARQVGWALGHGMLSSAVPAHRIVNSRGVLSGAGAFGKADTQRKRLAAEGVRVLTDNRVDMRKDGWKNTLEDALALQAVFMRKGI